MSGVAPSIPLIKGTVVLATVKLLRKHRERATALLPPALQHYLRERILPSSWYPEEDLFELARALVQILPVPPAADPWMQMGRWLIMGDITGVYRAHLKAGYPHETLLRAEPLWRTYHNTGQMKVIPQGDRAALVQLHDYAMVSREVCRLMGGCYTELVEQAGGRDARASKRACRLHGRPYCEWHVTWKTGKS